MKFNLKSQLLKIYNSKFLIAFIVIIIFLLYLYFTNAFEGYINPTVLDVSTTVDAKEFVKKKPSSDFLPGNQANNNQNSTCATFNENNNVLTFVKPNQRGINVSKTTEISGKKICGTKYKLNNKDAYCTFKNNEIPTAKKAATQGLCISETNPYIIKTK